MDVGREETCNMFFANIMHESTWYCTLIRRVPNEIDVRYATVHNQQSDVYRYTSRVRIAFHIRYGNATEIRTPKFNWNRTIMRRACMRATVAEEICGKRNTIEIINFWFFHLISVRFGARGHQSMNSIIYLFRLRFLCGVYSCGRVVMAPNKYIFHQSTQLKHIYTWDLGRSSHLPLAHFFCRKFNYK